MQRVYLFIYLFIYLFLFSALYSCEDQGSAAGCILGENGMSLKVGYRAPSLNDLHTLVVFRYKIN